MTAQLTITGNLTADPEAFADESTFRSTFTIAISQDKRDKETGAYIKAEPMYIPCVMWGTYAEHVADALRKGDHVIATGKLQSSTYSTSEGEKKTKIELLVTEIGPTLRYVN